MVKDEWTLVALVVLPVRFIQGWIFWAGGSRRFIYDPYKLDPHAGNWLANKLQAAMPGALLGANHIIGFLLQHFYLLYFVLIAFSAIELLTGLGLLLGFFTRMFAFISLLISITLMVSFGWQGATCMDEWTMAVSTFAMALVLCLSGSSLYSVDNLLLRTSMQNKKSFTLLGSGPVSLKSMKIWASICLLVTICFSLGTYNYYRGAIFSRYHVGPVSATTFQLFISNNKIYNNGNVVFDLYISGGTTAVPAYIMKIQLVDSKGVIIEEWDEADLSLLKQNQIINLYAYNKITTGPFGLIAPVSAKATIMLLPKFKTVLSDKDYTLKIILTDGTAWSNTANVV